MAYIKITIMALLLSSGAHAQTFAEWFSQKKTQKKYLLQQIAALQVYGGYLKTGYNIAKGGLGSITSYVGNEFCLHDGYYKHLSTVSIAVKNNPHVNDIIRWQQDILSQTAAIQKQAGLTSSENAYTNKVCQALLIDCDARIGDLQTVLTTDKTEMSDEERLRQISRLHQAMQDNYRFIAYFKTQLQQYARSKQQATRDINTLNRLYENH